MIQQAGNNVIASVRRVTALSSVALCLLFQVLVHADQYTATIAVTNIPVNGNWLIVNAVTNTWTNLNSLAYTQINTNSVSHSATNLFQHYADFPLAANINLGRTATNNITLTAVGGATLAISVSGTWARVTITTNVQTSLNSLRVPISGEPSATTRTNNANYLIQGMNAYATGSGANLISNRILEGSAIITGAVTGVTDSATVDLTKTGNNISAALSNTTVTAGNYGSATLVPTNVVDAQGRLTGQGTIPMWATNIGNSASVQLSLTANQISAALSNTTVAASSFGSSSLNATGTVDSAGRLTAIGTIPEWATNVANSADLMLSVTANQISGSISNSGVTAGNYGTASLVPTGVVNSAGRWTGIGTAAVVASSTNAVSTVGGIGNSSTTNNAATAVYVQGNLSHTNSGGTSFIFPTTSSGDFVQFFSTTLVAMATSVDISSIASGYSSILVEVVGRTTNTAGTSYGLWIRYNNDSGNNYDYQEFYGNTATATAAEAFGLGRIEIGVLSGGGAPAGVASFTQILIPEYAGSTWNKHAFGASAAKKTTASGGLFSFTSAGHWRSSVAITNITILPDDAGGALTNGTTIRAWKKL